MSSVLANQSPGQYGFVSWLAREAIGLPPAGPLDRFEVGAPWTPALVVENRATIEVDGGAIVVPARQRLSFQDVVWDPPDVGLRKVVRGE